MSVEELKKHSLYIDNRQYQTVKQEVTQKQDVKQEINIDIKIELPIIQYDFGKFKREVAKLDEDLKNELKDIEDELLEVTPKSEQKFNKIVKGSKKGIEYAQKLGKTYNKFAQWLALPHVPDLFLG